MPDLKIDEADLSKYDMFKDLPWLRYTVFGNTVYAYILTLISFILIWMLLHVLRRYIIAQLQRRAELAPISAFASLRDLLQHLSPGIFPLIALYVSTQRLELGTSVDHGIRVILMIGLIMQVARILSELAAFFINRNRAQTGGPDDAAVRNTNQNLTVLIRVGIWAVAFLFLLDNLGFNVSTFIAGLGIGGVAIALATQAILGDTFSSFAIALDKPFEVGDFIIVDNLMGNVEHVGLKTTRVRSNGGELLIFANSDLTKSRIKNFKKMFQRRATFNIGIVYDTPQDKLLRVVDILATAVTSQPDTRLDRAHFASFGPSALVFEVVYFVLKAEYNTYMDVQQAINLRIFADFEKEGLEMAFPTQTVHFSSGDDRLLVQSPSKI